MKRILGFVFLFIFAFQTAGFLVIFQIQRYSIKKEIKNQIKSGLPEDELIVFRIPANRQKEFQKNFLFFEENEFKSDGKMYDVVKVEQEGDTTLYYCLSDEKESALFANLDSSIKKSMDNSPENKMRVINFSSFIFSLFFSEPQTVRFDKLLIRKTPDYYFFSIRDWKSLPSTPPPIV